MPDENINVNAPALSKSYEAQAVQDEVWSLWESKQASHAVPDASKKPYAIVIPPPNVTAALHMGHALNNTLQDILVRWRRMAGDNAVWMPGTDHAGIATQTVVEKRVLMEQGKRRTDFTREEFIAKIQAWKDEYETTITGQLKAMGSSCDWQRQRFTMDPVCAAAVREAFFQLFKDGLIYRGKRLVNWDPATQTALADDEVENRELSGYFYYMKYPLADGSGHVTVATTRPETMLGDTAVAVNPNDTARAKFIGKSVRLPIVNRVIPIIGDDYVVIPNAESEDAKAKYASGFLKVTPAHDPNDYEIGRRHNLPVINVMSPTAAVSKDHGWPAEDFASAEPFATHLLGLDRYEAREAIIDWFREKGLLEEVKPYSHSVGHSYRSHVPIEPYLSDQWYVKVTDDKLRGAALRAMAKEQFEGDARPWHLSAKASRSPEAQGELRFHPARYAKTFQSWHENIRDWCISRQLWWGHRIPVWSKADRIHFNRIDKDKPVNSGEVTLNRVVAGVACAQRVVHGPSIEGTGFCDAVFYTCVPNCDRESEVISELESQGYVRDPDVLDTWFSSGLWPISTLGWPEPAKFPEAFAGDPSPDAALKQWNPSSTLCTAREIITLWVSRMVMFNIYFRGVLPFKDVFIHAMIQDGEGQKMSKSLGNGVDPLDIIHSHGADAMRFTLTQMTTQTQDVKMPVDLIDPHTGQTFTPKMITTKAGHRVMAPVQDSPGGAGKKMITTFGMTTGEAKATAEMPLARNTSSKFDDGRNFSNKLWNAGKFVLSKLEKCDETNRAKPQAAGLADRWILNRLHRTIAQADEALTGYQFNVYARSLYDFVWRDFCDWYLEAIKPVVDTDTPAGNAARATLGEVLYTSLRLLHPVMPFITEKLWQAMRETIGGGTMEELCMLSAWPVADAKLISDEVEREFDLAQQLVGAIRNVRNQYAVPPRKVIVARVKTTLTLGAAADLVTTLGGVELAEVGLDVKPGADAATAVVGTTEIYLEGLIDKTAEIERLSKRRDEVEKSRGALAGRLANPGYALKAPPHLVKQTQDALAEAEKELAAVEEKLKGLGVGG